MKPSKSFLFRRNRKWFYIGKEKEAHEVCQCSTQPPNADLAFGSQKIMSHRGLLWPPVFYPFCSCRHDLSPIYYQNLKSVLASVIRLRWSNGHSIVLVSRLNAHVHTSHYIPVAVHHHLHSYRKSCFELLLLFVRHDQALCSKISKLQYTMYVKLSPACYMYAFLNPPTLFFFFFSFFFSARVTRLCLALLNEYNIYILDVYVHSRVYTLQSNESIKSSGP